MAMLISGKLLTQLKDNLPSYNSIEFDPDMTFAAWMRERVSNALIAMYTNYFIYIYM